MEENNNKKVILTIIILILLVGGFIYYANNPTTVENKVENTITDKVTSESRVMIVKAGGIFTISLEKDLTGENIWSPVFDENSLEIVKERKEDANLITFEIKALKDGITEITFNYVKSSDTTTAPTDIKIFKIFVGEIE